MKALCCCSEGPQWTGELGIAKIQSYICGGKMPDISICWGMISWKGAWQKEVDHSEQ